MKILPLAASSLLLFAVISSCSQDSSSMAVISAEAVGNWVNFNGIPLLTRTSNFQNKGNIKDIRISPCEFYIDIRIIKLKNASGEWITLLDKGSTASRDIIGTSLAAPRTLVKPADYTALLIGLSENWYLKGTYTNAKGIAASMLVTNTNSSALEYFIFSTSAGASNAYNFRSGDFKQVYLFFDTIEMIHLTTDSRGGISNVTVRRPTLEINLY